MVREKISIVLKWFTPLVAIFIGVSPMLQMNLPARFHFAYGGLLNEICAAIVFLLLPMVWTTLSSLRKNKSWLRYGLFLGSFALATLLALVAPWTGIAMILEGVSLGLLLVHVLPLLKAFLSHPEVVFTFISCADSAAEDEKKVVLTSEEKGHCLSYSQNPQKAQEIIDHSDVLILGMKVN